MDAELVLVHWDSRPGEATNERWGQLAGGLRDLQFLAEELEDCTDQSNIERTIRRLHYHIVSFLHLTYWLRERAVWLAAGLCGDDTLADRLKDRRSRSEAIAQVARQRPTIVDTLATFLQLLKRDSRTRNIHTHESFVELQIMINDQPYDPIDVYTIDLGSSPAKQAEFGRVLIEAARRMVADYISKGEGIRDGGWAFLENASSILHPNEPI